MNSKDKTWGKYRKLSEDEFKHHRKGCEEHRKKKWKAKQLLNSTSPFSQITWNKRPSISQHTKERMSHVTMEITLENESDISKSIQFWWWTNTAGSTPITMILKAGHSFNSIKNPQTQNGHLCSIYNYLYITKKCTVLPINHLYYHLPHCPQQQQPHPLIPPPPSTCQEVQLLHLQPLHLSLTSKIPLLGLIQMHPWIFVHLKQKKTTVNVRKRHIQTKPHWQPYKDKNGKHSCLIKANRIYMFLQQYIGIKVRSPKKILQLLT